MASIKPDVGTKNSTHFDGFNRRSLDDLGECCLSITAKQRKLSVSNYPDKKTPGRKYLPGVIGIN
jgi:hypothetical protein